MTRAAIALLLAAPILITVAAVGRAQVNRADGRSPIVLTQREVRLTPRDDDSSAAVLSLAWTEGDQRTTWATRDKLRELGFDVSVHPDDLGAEAHYARQLQRDVFVAFELNGPAWQNVLAARERSEVAGQPVPADGLRGAGSRLVAVDADRDGAALAARYPNAATHLITRAVMRPSRVKPPSEPAYLYGTIVNILPRSIYVPEPWASQLPRRQFEANQAGYTVSVRYGRSWEPWVVRVER
jgi:hypothetical protein